MDALAAPHGEAAPTLDRDADGQHRPRLLIVEDASGLRDVLAMKLEREGYTALTADSTQAAAAFLGRESIDLILLDICLPDGNGIDWLARLREHHSPLDLPVIVISGLDPATEVVNALERGANDYLPKPFDLAVVLARVRTQLLLRTLKQANDRFLRVATHDLKKPLALMLDVARQLRVQYPSGQALDEDTRAALDLLVDSGEFMQEIIADLLELRAIRAGRLRLAKVSTDLGAIVRQAVARNTPYARSKGISLRMQFERDLPHSPADDLRLMQVLENLIGNAVKFCPRGAEVSVRTGRDGPWLRCEVSDTGPGIPEAEMDQLFTEYPQIRNRPTGGEKSTGLGLAICRELISLHKGQIGAHNNSAAGATFWFRLPVD